MGRLPLATNETYTNKQTNEKVTNTEWHNVVVRNKAAESCEKYLSKGARVNIEGRLKTRKWQDDKGSDRYSTEIVCTDFTFLTNKNDQSPVPSTASAQAQTTSNSDAKQTETNETDLPF